MKLPRYTFRIVLPVIYLVLGLLPVVGLIVTIAEGPNPFGSLLFVSMPGFYVVHAFNRVVTLPEVNFWIEMLAVLLVNMGIYFGIGYVLDFAINRRPIRKLPSPLTSGDIE
jgi:cytochrome b561